MIMLRYQSRIIDKASFIIIALRSTFILKLFLLVLEYVNPLKVISHVPYPFS
jgi:hypothetical protein